MMKKMKKLVAVVAALSLVMAMSVTVFAADPPAAPEPIIVEGETVYVDTELYSVVLPTAAAFGFTLDPQGLLAVAEGEDPASLKDLVGGRIYGSEAQSFVNNSSVPIKLSMDLTLASAAGTADEDAGEAVATFVTDIDDVEDATGTHNVLLVATPSTADLGSSEATYAPTEKGVALSDEAATFAFALPAADYTVEYTGGDTLAEKLDGSNYSVDPVADTGTGNALKMGGYINSQADWTDFTLTEEDAASTIKLTVEFSYAKDTDAADYTSESYDAIGAANLLKLADEAVKVDSPEVPAEPEVVEPEHDVKVEAGGTESYSMTKADLLATGVKIWLAGNPASITSVKNTTLDITFVSGTDFSYDAETGVLLFKRSISSNSVPLGIVAGGATYTVNLALS
ncbi:MAG: hypothetical protein AB7V55_00270 [Oscillospiraceae bacterium]